MALNDKSGLRLSRSSKAGKASGKPGFAILFATLRLARIFSGLGFQGR